MSSSGLTAGIVASSVDPRLGLLASNGGPTQTYAINNNSVALGGGLTSVAPTLDQRGLARVVGGAVDIGSYETQVIPATPSVGGPYSGYFNQSVLLDASGTSNPSLSSLTYTWTISGNGHTKTSSASSNPKLTANLSGLPVGTYQVTVQVSDGIGGNHTVTAQSSLTILPGLTVTSVAPASLASSVDTTFDTIDVTFAYPVLLSSLNTSSLALSLAGGPNLLRLVGFPFQIPNFVVTPVQGSPNTYRISGLAALMATSGQGHYTLTVNASQVTASGAGIGNGLGSLSASWIYDTLAPTSLVSPLPASTSGSSFVVSVTGSDPAPKAGVAVSGVVSYDIYVSTNGGPFAFWTNVPASSPSATYTGVGGNTYGFQSFARDAAGNLEAKPAIVEAGTYVPNQQAPGIHVTAVDTSKQLFVLTLSGTATNGGVLDHVDVYVSVNGGSPYRIARVADTNAIVTYEAIADTNLFFGHRYSFYAVGVDKAGNVQAAPAAPNYDITVSAKFYLATPNVPIALSVNHGAPSRSFVGSADLIFDDAQGLSSLISGNHVHLVKHALDGTGSTPISVTGLLSVVDHAIEFNFGALGLGGSPDSTSGDGYYEIDVDGIAQAFFFDRLFGDVNGDGVVDTTDASLTTAALGVNVPGGITDLDGSGTVTPLTRLTALRAKGHQLASGLHLDA